MTSQTQDQKQAINLKIRRLLQDTLSAVRTKEISERSHFIRDRLDHIQTYCKSVDKTFIFCEQPITCNQYALGGSSHHGATLFRGPNEDASVAICVTHQGSVLHRNDGAWRFYCDAGDTNPVRELAIGEFANAA